MNLLLFSTFCFYIGSCMAQNSDIPKRHSAPLPALYQARTDAADGNANVTEVKKAPFVQRLMNFFFALDTDKSRYVNSTEEKVYLHKLDVNENNCVSKTEYVEGLMKEYDFEEVVAQQFWRGNLGISRYERCMDYKLSDDEGSFYIFVGRALKRASSICEKYAKPTDATKVLCKEFQASCKNDPVVMYNSMCLDILDINI